MTGMCSPVWLFGARKQGSVLKMYWTIQYKIYMLWENVSNVMVISVNYSAGFTDSAQNECIIPVPAYGYRKELNHVNYWLSVTRYDWYNFDLNESYIIYNLHKTGI